MRVFRTNCREWQGYRPCSKQKLGLTDSCDNCCLYDPIQENVLIVEAGGLGSALRTSVVAKEIRRRSPNACIQWLTSEQSVELVEKNIPSVDRVYPTTWESLMILGAQVYSQIINFESNPLHLVFVSNMLLKKQGFVMGELGNLAQADLLIGLNIGSSQRHSAKRWPPHYFYELSKLCQHRHPEWKLLVLAGLEDVEAYDVIYGLNEGEPLGNLMFTGYGNTISQFISLVNRIPLIISADTFGLHVALGLGKRVISLWGPQPENETCGYGRERKISLQLDCAPCFAGRPEKCTNPNTLQCMKEIDTSTVYQILEQELS